MNVRLTDEEERAVRYWAYELRISTSELARRGMLELVERLAREREERERQVVLPI